MDVFEFESERIWAEDVLPILRKLSDEDKQEVIASIDAYIFELHKEFGCERRVDVAVNDNNSIFTPVQSEGLVAELDSVAFAILNNPDVNLGVGGICVLNSIEDIFFKLSHF